MRKGFKMDIPKCQECGALFDHVINNTVQSSSEREEGILSIEVVFRAKYRCEVHHDTLGITKKEVQND